MSELEKALAAVGESAPERYCDPRRPLLRHALVDIDNLESLALRLAVRLERAERCRECLGGGEQVKGEICAACSGTGKEQGR